MSTAAEHRSKQAARRWRPMRQAQERLRAGYAVVRPLVLLAVGILGFNLAIQELKRSPLHHNTIIWVLGFALAGAAVAGLYKEVRNRLLLRRWLDVGDRAELLDRLPAVRDAVASLPPWHRTRYLAKKRQIDEAPMVHSSHAHVGQVASRAARTLAQRLRHSAAFVLSILVLGAVGAFAFVQWLQIILSDFGNPRPWLATWLLVATYVLGFAIAVALDAIRRRRASPPID